MEENIYDFLGLTPNDSDAKVKEELDAQIKKWTNQLTRQAARAKAKLEVLKRFKEELGTNLNMRKEHTDKSDELLKQKQLKQEEVIFNQSDVSNPTKIFGIDFGTTYSSIAFVDEYGKPVTVPNQENSPVTPSVVFFETGGCVSVGDVAKEALIAEPELVCSDVKLQLGKEEYVFSANGTDYRPEFIIALIFKKLAIDTREKLGAEVKDVVITCPAYFGLDEKEATKKAAEIAGLNVLSIISEPTAAAISYGLKADEAQTVMVYDLGGRTFDVTIIKADSGVIEVIATGGDHNLGGKDWDAEIQKYAIDQYVQQTGGSADDIYDDIVALGDLELKSEQAKKRLTQCDKASFRLNGAKIEISVDQFENITASLLQSSIDKTRDTMNEAATKGVTHYDKILLVGGSTLMPQVKKRLEQEFAGTPIESCDPNESVARGAAIYGKQMLHSDDPIEPFVQPVLSKGIALSIIHDKNNFILHNVFVKNTPLPCAKIIHTKTIREFQNTICLGIYDHDYIHTSSDMIADMRFLTSKTVQLSKPLPISSPIDILVQVNEEGLLADINIVDVLNDDIIIVKLELHSILY